MSRRRDTPRYKVDHIRFDVECDGSAQRRHAVERIAKVTVKEWPDAEQTEGGAIQVDYVRVDMDPEDNDYMMSPRISLGDVHATRRFPCSQCHSDKPIRDLHLVRLGRQLDALGQRRVRLRELP